MASDDLSEPSKRKIPVVRVLAVIALLAVGVMLFLQKKQRELVEICTFNLGAPEETLAACDTLLKWVQNSPQATSLTYRHRMRVFMAQEDWAAAAREVDLAIAADPQSATPWQWKAKVLTETEQYDRAMETIDQALAIAPGSDYSLEFKAKLLRRLDRFDEIEPLVENAIANPDVGNWAWSYAGYFRLRAEDYPASALAFAEALRRDPHDAYDRRKFLEACRYAGPECPPLFPDKRAGYPELSCSDAIDRWGEIYGKPADEILSDSGYATLSDLFEQGGFPAKAIVQAVYLGPASEVEINYTPEYARKFIVVNRVFDCVNGGEFVFSQSSSTDEELRFANEHLHSPELRRNLVDLVYTDLH